MSLKSVFKNKVITPIIAGAASIAAIFSPVAASETVSTVSVEKQQKVEPKPADIQFLDTDAIESKFDKKHRVLRAQDFVHGRSMETPVILMSVNGQNQFLHAAEYANKIYQFLKHYGYEAEVWAMKADVKDACNIQFYYKNKTFDGANKLGNKQPKDAFDHRAEFGDFCQIIDRDEKKAKITPVVTASITPQ